MINKKILMMGDSLTRGILGINFVRMLEDAFPQCAFVNRGKGGDTLYGIAHRLQEELEKHEGYDIIVIEAGHNDILIPIGEHRDLLHRASSHFYQIRGSIVTSDLNEFEARYNAMIDRLREYTDVPIIVTTLSCLGEDLTTEPNIKRGMLNDIIRRVADKHHLILADVGERFDERLKALDNPKTLLYSQFASRTLVDVLRSYTIEGAQAMSKERGMSLVVDGVHLNGEGAKIYFKTIQDCLKPLLENLCHSK